MSLRLNRHIRTLAVGKHGSRPILKEAQQAFVQGLIRVGT
jgi:hypothetical protein